MFTTLSNIARSVIPAPARARIRDYQRQRLLDRSMREFRSLLNYDAVPQTLLADLVRGWGNEGWSAQHEYIQSFVDQAQHVRGPILECGSGLSTLLLGCVAQRRRNVVYTLEHQNAWAQKVRGALTRYGIDAVRVCVAPLKSYGQFSWYDVAPHNLPRDFSLVICDGPPSDTPGERYGLLPVLRQHLAPGCTILLDDIARQREQEIIAQWGAELGTRPSTQGSDKPFGVLTVPN